MMQVIDHNNQIISTPSFMTVHTGSCRCGNLRFSVKDNSTEYRSLCHCRHCRLATSAPVSMVIGVSKDHFEWTQGEETWLRIAKISDQMDVYYCGHCGGHVAQGGLNYPFVSTFACVYDEMKQEFCPRDQVLKKEVDQVTKQFFTPEYHVNYENRVIDIPDDLPKYMDFPSPIGSGRMYLSDENVHSNV
ncbi:hypothetical protein FDP41_005997 [Naegleria fowleri]|uniref:CENP-V/GFA domain-containing protein n=1 Tax=Naegleria fowleri TaxID=5763 RepID=A0A6A5BNW0_NAEFO|nr:uncharacterized protein FDP41_005997 [Naegleria fowleri]KAF0975245.1 hypothetical protein FDP41_005997 [Naegleria fowleri]